MQVVVWPDSVRLDELVCLHDGGHLHRSFFKSTWCSLNIAGSFRLIVLIPFDVSSGRHKGSPYLELATSVRCDHNFDI